MRLSIRRSRRAKESPEWQNTAVQTVKDAYDEKDGKVDDTKVRQLLVENGLNTDKRVMPFIQAFKVRIYLVLLFNLR